MENEKCKHEQFEEGMKYCPFCGRTFEGYALGAMICKTEEFKRAGGFPKLDTFVINKLGSQLLIVEEAICQHLVPKGLSAIRHTFHWFTHGFQTENVIGIYTNPIENVRYIFHYLKVGLPDYAVSQFIWLLKDIFAIPIILLKRGEKNC